MRRQNVSTIYIPSVCREYDWLKKEEKNWVNIWRRCKSLKMIFRLYKRYASLHTRRRICTWMHFNSMLGFFIFNLIFLWFTDAFFNAIKDTEKKELFTKTYFMERNFHYKNHEKNFLNLPGKQIFQTTFNSLNFSIFIYLLFRNGCLHHWSIHNGLVWNFFCH